MKYSDEDKSAIIHSLYSDSNNLTQPCLYPNFFNHTFLNENQVKQSILTAIQVDAKENFRIWINKIEQKHAIDHLFNTAMQENENLETWLKRVFAEDNFCIFFSRAEPFNDEIAINLATFLLPLFEKLGITMGGCTLTTVLGNYGYTPVGVHQDIEVNSVFHFHLGPHDKEILFWEPDTFQQLTGSLAPYHEPEKIMHAANVFRIQPTDLLFLPPKHFHIGRAERFSIDLALVLSDSTNVKFTQDIFQQIAREGLARRSEQYTLTPMNVSENIRSLVAETVQHVCVNDHHSKRRFEEVITDHVEDYYLSMLSNLSFSYPPLLRDKTKKIDIMSHHVKLTHPYKMYYKLINENRMQLFLRGRELIANYYEDIFKLIDMLNKGFSYSIQDLLTHFTEEAVTKKRLLGFLKQAAEYQAVQIC